MTTRTDITDLIQKIRPVLTRYGIRSASLVDSVAYGEDTPDSDIDLVVEIERPMSLLTFVTLKLELEELLERKVDLLERSAIKLRLRQSLLSREMSLI